MPCASAYSVYARSMAKLIYCRLYSLKLHLYYCHFIAAHYYAFIQIMCTGLHAHHSKTRRQRQSHNG